MTLIFYDRSTPLSISRGFTAADGAPEVISKTVMSFVGAMHSVITKVTGHRFVLNYRSFYFTNLFSFFPSVFVFYIFLLCISIVLSIRFYNK